MHAHIAFEPALMAAVCKLVRKSKLVVTTHGSDVLKLRFSPLHKLLQTRVFEKADAVTTGSLFTKDILVEDYRVPQEKVFVVPNGYDEELIERAKRISGPKERLQLVTVGAFRKEKDPLTTLRAFELLAQKFPGLRLVMVGDGPLKEELQKHASAAGLSVAMPGVLLHLRSLAVVSSSAVYISSSVVEGGRPSSIVEAMALGVPPVVSSIPPHKELVEDRETGMLFPAGNYAELADKVASLLTDESLYKSVCAAAEEEAKKYAWSKVVDMYLDVYEG